MRGRDLRAGFPLLDLLITKIESNVVFLEWIIDMVLQQQQPLISTKLRGVNYSSSINRNTQCSPHLTLHKPHTFNNRIVQPHKRHSMRPSRIIRLSFHEIIPCLSIPINSAIPKPIDMHIISAKIPRCTLILIANVKRSTEPVSKLCLLTTSKRRSLAVGLYTEGVLPIHPRFSGLG